MSDRRYVVESIRDFDYMDKKLGRLRQWLEGFQQAGGQVPHDFDVLRQCQIALTSAKPLNAAEEFKAAERRFHSAMADLGDAHEKASAAAYKLSATARDASADTHPKGGDSTQIEAPAPLSGAVGEAETPNA